MNKPNLPEPRELFGLSGKTETAVCTRCTAKGLGCCSLGGANRCGDTKVNAFATEEPQCFPLSEAECERILAALPALRLPVAELADNTTLPAALPGPDNFFATEANSPAFLDSIQALFPDEQAAITKLWPDNARHKRLYLPNRRDCVFLSARGCLLPAEARPWFCRLYPFWVIKGRLRCFTPEDCLAVAERPSLNGLLRTFELDAPRVLKIYAQLRRDWGLDP